MATDRQNKLLLKLVTAEGLTLTERVLRCCRAARDFEEKGEFEEACRALAEFWPRVGASPILDGLDLRSSAELLLCAGSLSDWAGSSGQNPETKQMAHTLLGGSIAFFRWLNELSKVAEAEIALACYYWRMGLFKCARLSLRTALDLLPESEIDLRAIALVRMAEVERSDSQYGAAKHYLAKALPVVEASDRHSIKGRFHNTSALILHNSDAEDARPECSDQILAEYAAASYHYEKAGNTLLYAQTENNTGFLYLTLGRFQEANVHLELAGQLFAGLGNQVYSAQVDETRARALIAEGRLGEAAEVIRRAVEVLEHSGLDPAFAEALTTEGIVLARLGSGKEARAALEKARVVAESCGDSSGAARAALTLLEEMCESLSDDYRRELLTRADQLIGTSSDPELQRRRRLCAHRVAEAHAAFERARVAQEERLRQAALHDPLTGLANRALFTDNLRVAVERANRDRNYLFAVLFLDLDRFKVINDSLGHVYGDQLLVELARRLETCVRQVDTVARFGGDEFGILLNGIKDADRAIHIAQRIKETLDEPFNIDGNDAYTTVSIGIALSAPGVTQPLEMLRDADTAMYRAKELGRSRYEVFDRDMHARAVALLRLENDLRRAIERQEFHLFYQPIVSLQDGTLTGFEALIRWQHPDRGLVSPGEFIPIAEETGMILPIGQWVLTEACQQMRAWQRKFKFARDLTISINLSGRQLAQPDLTYLVKQVLQESGLDARRVKLEITESVVMENAEAATQRLKELRELGVSLSIDDFGTGYSSLSYLHRFPVTTLKIDRSFVSRIGNRDENLEIIRTIVTLARNLKMDIVAEGVETEQQLAQLARLGCENAQGYLLSRPLSTENATSLIESRQMWQTAIAIDG